MDSINGTVRVVGNVYGSIQNKEILKGNVSKAETVYVKELHFASRLCFPSIGKDNIIYVAKDEHKMYMFNSTTLTYEVIGSDYNEIEIIQGKL